MTTIGIKALTGIWESRAKDAWQILKHPVTAIIITLFVSWVFFESSRSEKKPLYAVGSQELIASSSVAGHLKITFDGTYVPNVYRVKIALWNSGNQYIDSKDFSDTDRWRLEFKSKEGAILSASIVAKSRPTLNVTTTPGSEIDTYTEYLAIRGDDAFEKNDGVVIQLLFTGRQPVSFDVLGRVKGTTSGFRSREWSPSEKWEMPFFLISGIVFVVVFLLDVRSLKSSASLWADSKFFRILSIMFSSLLILGAIFCFLQAFAKYGSTIPSWAL